jgi:hypothetical protein
LGYFMTIWYYMVFIWYIFPVLVYQEKSGNPGKDSLMRGKVYFWKRRRTADMKSLLPRKKFIGTDKSWTAQELKKLMRP